jgi:hypothetical protein
VKRLGAAGVGLFIKTLGRSEKRATLLFFCR